jgi:2-methylcitrate synthase/citrate synthase II
MTETYSPGLEGVVAGETAISTVETGLTYRGYTIEDLAANSTYEEVAYLILHGELPTAEQLSAFHGLLSLQSDVPSPIVSAIRSIPEHAPTMDVLRTGCSMLAHWDPDTDRNDHDSGVRKATRLLAQLPVILAARHRLKQGKSPVPADRSLSFAANLLWMLKGEEPTSRQVKAMDVSLILYAEHEFNASTFAARCVVSTLSDLHSAITAAIGTLKGPLHGGANERAMEVLLEVGTPARAESWVRDALAQKKRIMGFGHRVYREGDPRAVYLKKLTAEVAKETGHDDMEQMAETIEQIVRAEKKLPPNVDWPCARLYHYLGLPVDLYTPLFVVACVVGWSAHVIEQLDNNRLIRPRAIYKGPAVRTWTPLNAR